ncbi:MAG: hypothetical protein ACLPTZ_20585 [Beijerinckiaceae bacterium]
MPRAAPRAKPDRSVIAKHPERARIEYDLARGVPVRVVGKKYGLSKDACYRHLEKMPAEMKADKLAELLKPGANLDALKLEESEGLLANLQNQRIRLLLVQDVALELADAEMVTRTSAQIHRNLELVGKYLGELSSLSSVTVTNNIIMSSPEFLHLQSGLLSIARAHPDARMDIVALLRGLERGVPSANLKTIEVREAAVA